jgi:hypothetical protein
MPSAVKAICPGCKKILRIPPELIEQPVRCRHCDKAFRVRSKTKTMAGPPPVIAGPPGQPPRHRRPAIDTPEPNAGRREPGVSWDHPTLERENSESVPVVDAGSSYFRRFGRRTWITVFLVGFFGAVAVIGYFIREPLQHLRGLSVDREQTISGAGSKNGSAKVDLPAVVPERPVSPSRPIPDPHSTKEPMAERSEIQGLLQEIDVPAIESILGQTTPSQIDRLPFSAKAMQAYRADYSLGKIRGMAEKFPFRAGVLNAVKVLNEQFKAEHPAILLRRSFPAQNSAKIKGAALKEQTMAAKALLKLQEALEELRRVGEKRDQESSKRWQAHYDYVLARLLTWIALVNEYDLMLGKFRRDELPELMRGVHTGYRLASQDKLQSGKDIKDLVAESKQTLVKLAKDNPGTPWEALSKRAQLAALGLKWEPSP